MTPAGNPLTIDVVSDVVCPWCFIGKRRLEAALALAAAEGTMHEAVVRWHPFELNPDLPTAGIERSAYLEAKFGGPDRATQIYDRVRAAGESAGIPFAFERIESLCTPKLATLLTRGLDLGGLVARLDAARRQPLAA